MTLISLLRSVRTQFQAASIIREQTELLNQASSIIILQQEDLQRFKEKEESVNALKLEHLRNMQGMAAAWLLNLENPDTEVHERIAQLAQLLGEDIARLEEYVLD